MAFFTRKGLTVPDFPSDCVLTEEPEEFNLPSTPSSLATSTPDEITTNKSITEVNTEFDAITKENAAKQQPNDEVTLEEATGIDENANESAVSSKADDSETNEERDRFDYVVDRTYGVEV